MSDKAPDELWIHVAKGAPPATRFHGYETDIGNCTRYVKASVADGRLAEAAGELEALRESARLVQQELRRQIETGRADE